MPSAVSAAPALPFSAAHPQYAAVLSTALAQETSANAEVQKNIDEDFDPEDFGLSGVGFLPNNPLYIFKAVRRGWSDAFTNDPADKIGNSLRFAAERLLEAEALAERGARESSVASALDGFRREVERARARAADAVAELGDTEEGKALAAKMMDAVIKYQKLIGKIEKGTSGRAVSAAADAKTGTGEALGAAFSFVPETEAAGTLAGVLDAQRGSDFKEFKNIEVLKSVEAQVPDAAKPAIRAATAHALAKLEDNLSSEAGSRSALGDYMREVGGNEVRHLEIIQDLEVRPLSEDARATLVAVKEGVLSRAEVRLAALPTAEKQAFLKHLNEGTMEGVRVVKELENNISADAFVDVAAVATAAKQNFAQRIETAATNSGERAKLLESVERFHDAKSLSVLDEIASLIPPEQQSVFAALKEKAAAEIQNDISRARDSSQKEAFYRALSGDHPDELSALRSFGVGESIAEGIRTATAEQIKARVGAIRDETRLGKYEDALRAANTGAGDSSIDLATFFAQQRVVFGSRDKAEAKIASAAALVEELSGLTASLPLNLGYGDEGFDPSIRNVARLLNSAERRLASARAALARDDFGFAYNEAQETEFTARDGTSVARAYKSGRRAPETKTAVESGKDIAGGEWRLYNRSEFQRFCISFGGTLTETLSCAYDDGRIFTVPKDSFPVVVPAAFRPTEQRVAPLPVLIVDPGKPLLLPVLDPSKAGRCGGPENYGCGTGLLCIVPKNLPAVVGDYPVYGSCETKESVEKRKDITCQAYFEGYVYDSTASSCRKDSASGCSNPFVYKTKDECEVGIRAEVSPERDTARWVEHAWKFSDGVESSMILDRTDSEYLRYIKNVETTCRLTPKQQFIWKPGAGNDAADNWQNFGIPDCSGQAFAPANCGNNICESGETVRNCAKDCSAGTTARDAFSCPGFAHERIGSRGERYCQINSRTACSSSYPQYLYESSYSPAECPSDTGGGTASTTAQFGNCSSNTSRTGCEANQDCDWYVPPSGSPYCSLAVRGSWTSHIWRFSDGGTETSSILGRTDREYSEFIASIDAQCKLITRSKFAWKPGAGNDAADNWQNFGIPDCTGTATNTGTTGGGGYGGDATSCPGFAYSKWDQSGRRYCQLNSERKCDYAYPSYLVNGPNYKDTNCPAGDTTTGGTATTTTTGGGGTSSMQKCFYPNASKNGAPVGYTVWCESDYVNCHEGSPSGASISLTGVSLGAPSSCESGWTGGPSGSCNSNNYCDPWESAATCPSECGSTTGGGGSVTTTCDSALTALLGTGCHNMYTDSSGNTIFCDGPMTKSAKRGDTATTAGCSTTGGGGGSTTGGGTPAIPTGVTATAPSTGNTVDLRWTDASTNETYFKIWRQANGSWAFLTQTSSAPENKSTTGTVMSYSDQSVPSGSVSYQIQACNETSCSQDSSLASVWIAGGGGTTAGYCGDRICQSSESSASCPADCGTTGVGGTTTSTTCDSATTALLGTGCHSMGNAFFNSEMTRYVWPGGSTVLECSTGYVSGCSGSGGGTTSGTQCTSGQYWNGTSCVSSSSTSCPSGQYWNGSACTNTSTTDCTSGQYWNGSACVTSESGGQYGSCGSYATQESCTGATNCYWNTGGGGGSPYCYYSSSGGASVWQAFKSWLTGE